MGTGHVSVKQERWQSENDKLRRRQYFMYEMVRKEIENTKVSKLSEQSDYDSLQADNVWKPVQP